MARKDRHLPHAGAQGASPLGAVYHPGEQWRVVRADVLDGLCTAPSVLCVHFDSICAVAAGPPPGQPPLQGHLHQARQGCRHLHHGRHVQGLLQRPHRPQPLLSHAPQHPGARAAGPEVRRDLGQLLCFHRRAQPLRPRWQHVRLHADAAQAGGQLHGAQLCAVLRRPDRRRQAVGAAQLRRCAVWQHVWRGVRAAARMALANDPPCVRGCCATLSPPLARKCAERFSCLLLRQCCIAPHPLPLRSAPSLDSLLLSNCKLPKTPQAAASTTIITWSLRLGAC